MKKLIISCATFIMFSAFAKAQAPAGLDSIIVEKYYVSDANDTTVNSTGGKLPLNSVTYRIFVDMKPGYKFQAAYGVDAQPVNVRNAGDHELRIETSTLFFNNEDRGATTPTFTKAQARNNTVMLDSWLTVGGACAGNMGVLKTQDNGVATNANLDGVLTNNNPYAGIPLTTEDGLIAGTPEVVTSVGINSELVVFDAQNDGTNGPVFSTFNGSVASLNGSVGPNADNRVLIGQITTNGVLKFKLNIQLGTPTPGVSENWVADSPVGTEATHPTLTYIDSLSIIVTGLKNNLAGSANVFNVYPNPTNDQTVISLKNASVGSDNAYTVYSLDGKVVLSKKLGAIAEGQQERIDMSNLKSGLYYVELTFDGVKSTKKIVKN